MINKVDRALFELKHDSETIYQNFQRVIENANVIIATYQKIDTIGDCQVYPYAGNVGMGSALHGWGFTVNVFARMYADKCKCEPKKLLNRLWGDNYFNAKKGTWTTDSTGGEGLDLKRAFCQFVMDPIIKLANSLLEGKKEIYLPMIQKLGIKLVDEDYDLQPKYLVRKVMQNGSMPQKPFSK